MVTYKITSTIRSCRDTYDYLRDRMFNFSQPYSDVFTFDSSDDLFEAAAFLVAEGIELDDISITGHYDQILDERDYLEEEYCWEGTFGIDGEDDEGNALGTLSLTLEIPGYALPKSLGNLLP